MVSQVSGSQKEMTFSPGPGGDYLLEGKDDSETKQMNFWKCDYNMICTVVELWRKFLQVLWRVSLLATLIWYSSRGDIWVGSIKFTRQRGGKLSTYLLIALHQPCSLAFPLSLHVFWKHTSVCGQKVILLGPGPGEMLLLCPCDPVCSCASG